MFDPAITNPGYISYVADGTNATYLIGYEYADQLSIEEGDVSANLIVRVDGIDATYVTHAGGTQVVLDDVPDENAQVEIFRDSDYENFLVNWVNRTTINQTNLKRMGSQMIWLVQENLQRVRYLRDQFAVFIDASDLVEAAADEFTRFDNEITQLEADLAALEALFDVTGATDGQLLVYDTDAFKNKTISGDFLIDSAAVVSIQPNVVGSTELAANAVITDKILDANVTLEKMAADAIYFIEHGGIAADELNDLSDVTIVAPDDGDLLVYDTSGAAFKNQAASGAFSMDETGATTLLADAVATATIQNLAVTAAKIQTDAVTTDKLAAGAVIAGKLGPNVVDTDNVIAEAITGDKIANLTIRTQNFQNGVVTTAKIGALAVETANIEAEAVTAAKLANYSVTLEKLAAEVSEVLDEPNSLYDITSPATGHFLIYDTSAFKNVPITGDITFSAGGTATIAAGAISQSQLDFTALERSANDQANVGGLDDTNFLFDGEVVVGRAASLGGTKDGMYDSRLVSTARTADATPTSMSPTLTIPDGDTWLFTIRVSGRDDASGDFWSNAYHGHISREGASTTGTVSEDTDVPSNKPGSWAVAVTIDDVAEALDIEVTGVALTDINWAATVEITRTLQ